MERYELVEGTAAKFWQWEIRDTDLVVSFGRLGTNGQQSIKPFASVDEARKAAAKLVREKLAKGYGQAGDGTPSSPPPSRSEPSAPTDSTPAASDRAAASPTLPRGASSEEPELTALAAKYKRCIQSGDGLFGVMERLGRRATLRSLFRVAGSGLLPPKVLIGLLGGLAEHVTIASPDELIAVLLRVPKKLGPGHELLLDEYSHDVDALLMHAAHRGATALASVEENLPPNVRRALPWVRRRLGQPTCPPSPALLGEHVRRALWSHDPEVWHLEQGRLVLSSTKWRFDRWVELLGAPLGTAEAFVGEVRAQAFADGKRNHQAGWRAEPAYLAMPREELSKLLDELHFESEYLPILLAKRADPPEALVDALGKVPKDRRSSADVVAVAAARAFAAEGKPVPKKLDGHVGFKHGHMGQEARALYLEGLRAFPRERLLARFDRVMAARKESGFMYAVLGLRAHWDEARFTALARERDLQDRYGSWLAQAGPDALGPLVAILRAMPAAPDGPTRTCRDELRRAVTVVLDEIPGNIDPALDPWLGKPASHAHPQWERVLQRLPQDRRDGVILAAHAEDPGHLEDLHLASDAGIEAAIARVFAERKRLSKHAYNLRFDSLGARAVPALVRAFSGATDAAAKRILDEADLDDGTYARLTGGATPLPAVSGSIADGTRYLSLVAPHLDAAEPIGTLAIPSGRVMFVREAGYVAGRALARSVPAGEHVVTTRYADDRVDDLDGLPTAGLEALMVRFAAGSVTRWEEAKDGSGDPVLTREVVTMALVDAERAGARTAALTAAHLPEADRHVTHGDAIGFLEDGHALVAYVGEVAHEHALYWGLGANGEPVCLVAAFELPRG